MDIAFGDALEFFCDDFLAYGRDLIHEDNSVKVVKLVLHHTAGKAGKFLTDFFEIFVVVLEFDGGGTTNAAINSGHAETAFFIFADFFAFLHYHRVYNHPLEAFKIVEGVLEIVSVDNPHPA